MPNEATTPDVASPLTREDLFPEGWDQPKPDVVEGESDEKTPDAAQDDEQSLADEQLVDDESEAEQSDETGDALRLYDFAKQAGWKLDEFYSGVTVPFGGDDVPIGKALNEVTSLKEANDALLKERSELQERVSQTAVQAPQMGGSPEAAALKQQAQMLQQQLQSTDWSQWDKAEASSAQVQIWLESQRLEKEAEAKEIEHRTKAHEQMREALTKAERLVRERVPEWNDNNIRNESMRNISDMLLPYGINPNELNTVIDPRWWHFFNDAMKLKSEKARITKGARKKVRGVGKVLGGGSRGTELPKAPTLRDAKQALAEARKKGLNSEELRAMRLQVDLPSVPGKSR